MSADPAAGQPRSISVLALDGIPEIRIGDDLRDIIGDAIARTAGRRAADATTTSSS